jgi:hypothetical protein
LVNRDTLADSIKEKRIGKEFPQGKVEIQT